VYDKLKTNPNMDFIFQLDSLSRLGKFFALKPWDQRPQNSFEVQQDVQKVITGFPPFNNFFVSQPPPLPSTFGNLLPLAQRYSLSVYDAAYVELANQRGGSETSERAAEAGRGFGFGGNQWGVFGFRQN